MVLCTQALGQVGRVIRVFPTGDVRVAVSNSAWTFNPLCMVPAPGEPVPDTAGEKLLRMSHYKWHAQFSHRVCAHLSVCL